MGFKEFLFLVTTLPALEKSRSEGVDVAGMLRYSTRQIKVYVAFYETIIKTMRVVYENANETVNQFQINGQLTFYGTTTFFIIMAERIVCLVLTTFFCFVVSKMSLRTILLHAGKLMQVIILYC